MMEKLPMQALACSEPRFARANVFAHARARLTFAGRAQKAVRRHFHVMPYGARNIWGVTAGILRNLYERLTS